MSGAANRAIRNARIAKAMQFAKTRAGFGVTWDIGDLAELESALRALEDVPQRCVTSAAGKGANLVKRHIKAGNVPVRTGALKQGIVRTKKEKSRFRGKAVYRVDFKGGEEANSIFQKPVKNPGAAGSTSTPKRGYAYYPFSMEFGFIARDGTYRPGFHFMRDGAEEMREEVNAVMVKKFTERLEKEWTKQHGH